MGFRYRCQQCHNYQLCQECFWKGLASGSHSNQHQMKEYTSWVRHARFNRFLPKSTDLNWTFLVKRINENLWRKRITDEAFLPSRNLLLRSYRTLLVSLWAVPLTGSNSIPCSPTFLRNLSTLLTWCKSILNSCLKTGCKCHNLHLFTTSLMRRIAVYTTALANCGFGLVARCWVIF